MPFDLKASPSENPTLTDIDEKKKPIVAVFSDDSKLEFKPADKVNQKMFDGLEMVPANHEEPEGVTKQVRMLVIPKNGPQFFLHKHAPKHYVETCIRRIEKGV